MRKKMLLVILALVSGSLIFWASRSSTTEVYDVIRVTMHMERSFKQYLPDFLEDLLFSSSSGVATLEVVLKREFLRGKAQDELKSILEGRVFPTGRETISSNVDRMTGFVFSRDHEWYILYLFEWNAASNDSSAVGDHLLRLYKAERSEDGFFKSKKPEENFFKEDDLYRKLKDFLNRYDPSGNCSSPQSVIYTLSPIIIDDL